MNILIILNDLDIGGAQNYTISLMNEFIKLGYKVELRVLSNNLLLKHRLDEHINVKVWERKKKLDFSVLIKIRNEIKQGKYDGVIASHIIYQKFATLFLKHLPITIYPIHSTMQRSKKAVILNYFIFRSKRKNEVFLTSITNQTKYLTEKYHLRKTFFNQIYNGVDTDRFTLPPSNFNREKYLLSKGINPANNVILMIAGFRKEKRHNDAINAFKLLSQSVKDVSIVFVGDNRKEEYNKLITYASKKDSENIHFFTAETAGDVRNFYWSSDIFTLTSNQVETFPISSLEAMASGLPCVLTNVGGAVNIIKNKKNGIIVEPENIISISKGWEECLKITNKSLSLEIRNSIVANYSIKTSANKYLELIPRNNVN